MTVASQSEAQPVVRKGSRLEAAAIVLLGPILVAVAAAFIYAAAFNRGPVGGVIIGAVVWAIMLPWFLLVAWSRFLNESNWAYGHMPLIRRIDVHSTVAGMWALGYLAACADHRQFGVIAVIALGAAYVCAFAKMAVHEAMKGRKAVDAKYDGIEK